MAESQFTSTALGAIRLAQQNAASIEETSASIDEVTALLQGMTQKIDGLSQVAYKLEEKAEVFQIRKEG